MARWTDAPSRQNVLPSMVWLALVFVVAALAPVRGEALPKTWEAGTAHTLPDGRMEVGVFQPFRWGITDSLELSTHPLVDLLMPGVRIKKGWGEVLAGSVATALGVSCPTPLLSLLSREGTGGILPAETVVPIILVADLDGYWTWDPSSWATVTLRLGVEVAGTMGEEHRYPTIDLPLVYVRTASHHTGWVPSGGLDLDGRLATTDFYYSVDVDLFYVPDTGPSVEHKLLLSWRASETFALSAGYKLVWGTYPFGTDLHVLPLVDATWGW